MKKVYINGNLKNTIEFTYPFKEIINYADLIWDNYINNCKNFFYSCKKKTEIVLENFANSLVNEMNYMFYGSSTLTSLNVSNFNTSKVKIWNICFILVLN